MGLRPVSATLPTHHGPEAHAPQRVSLLVWTTTPWTLISNHFAAVGPDIDYSLVHDETADEYLYLATALVDATAKVTKHALTPAGACKGSDLIGLRYTPPFDCYAKTLAAHTAERKDGGAEPLAWRIVPGDFIDLGTGTGIVHIAPAYGEVDFNLLQDERRRFVDELNSIPLLNAVAPDGTFNDEAPSQYRGRWVKDCDKDIIRELKDRGLLLHQETIEHEYPFCPRAEDDTLIQYASKSWFVRTSQFKDEFLANNAKVNWLPDHIQEGRFGDFLRNNVDWALSRERYWGTPLPIWVCEQTGKMEAIGSFAELTSKPGATDGGEWDRAKAADPTLPDHLRVHKPYIDAWTYDSPFAAGSAGVSPARMRRVPEVIDCWWDAGSMPFAQWGFPHARSTVDTFVQRFPADFISEAIDQTRGWFYGLLAISTLLFGQGSMGLRPVQPGAKPRGVLRRPVDLTLSQRRRILPHWEVGGSTYFLTFRIQHGELAPTERTLVLDACRYWDGERMMLHAAVVMPNHVHLLCTPRERAPGQWWSLADLMHSIKGYTAQKLNLARGTTGHVWQQEYFDRIIRNDRDFEEKWNYIVSNPARRGLAEDYAWVWVEEDGPEAHAPHGPEADAPHGPEAHAPLYPHPYSTCIVLGHVMGEDGLKMSKRKKNYREPSYIFEHYGADAMRWFFFIAQTPWTSIRFQEANIRDAQREFLVRLYNVFSFFNIYANIDGFEVSDEATERRSDEGAAAQSNIQNPKSKIAGTGWRPPGERAELDRWIISELHRTITFVRESLDRFENFPAARRLSEFVDALSNWYVRRARERFWRKVEATERPAAAGKLRDGGSDSAFPPSHVPTFPRSHVPTFSPADQDKWDAYHTLYGVLWTLSQLIAPFTPFFAETMYRNLAGQSDEATKQRSDEGGTASGGATPSSRSLPAAAGRSVAPSLPVSVHLCDYPVADPSLIDEALAHEMDLVRDIVSLGRAARTAARLKVRQPLALAEIILARREHTTWLEAHSALIAEELNIKRVEFTSEAEHYVSYRVKPDFKAIGPKFGPLAPQVAGALAKLDPAATRRTLVETGRLTLEVANQTLTLLEQDVAIRLEAKPGWSAALGRGGVVVVQTELTDELRDEGLCRELIHQVQTMRKTANLPYEARIRLYVQGADKLLTVVRRFAEVIESECLAPEIVFQPPPAGVEPWTGQLEGLTATVALVPG